VLGEVSIWWVLFEVFWLVFLRFCCLAGFFFCGVRVRVGGAWFLVGGFLWGGVGLGVGLFVRFFWVFEVVFWGFFYFLVRGGSFRVWVEGLGVFFLDGPGTLLVGGFWFFGFLGFVVWGRGGFFFYFGWGCFVFLGDLVVFWGLSLWWFFLVFYGFLLFTLSMILQFCFRVGPSLIPIVGEIIRVSMYPYFFLKPINKPQSPPVT